jgi:lipopolysaccharide transport system ATP-binding protein
MSSERPAVSVRDLSKCYQIYARPADRLKQFVAPRLQRAIGAAPKCYFREFWALREASFEVALGESLGIIGRNGSGKSTLLQIICGTLTPTTGTVETNGRVAALLELGSGFNPEFSGRDNVYLNAALLGLSREQVDQRFDDIAAFADVGEHLEQPVKTYSSGMFVRLAFAVMAHVDAEILVVDEALSVGDAVFTQRCMRFIRSFQERGTLLFVSHDTPSIQNLCQRALWLDHGRIQQIGPSKAVSEAYLRHSLQDLYGDSVALKPSEEVPSAEAAESAEAQPAAREASASAAGPVIQAETAGMVLEASSNLEKASGFGTGQAQLVSVTLEKLDADESPLFKGGERVRVRVRARALQPLARPIIGFIVRDRLGQDLFGENTLGVTALRDCRVEAGQEVVGTFVFRLPMLPNGQYSVMSSVADGDQFDNVQHHYLHDALILTVSSAKVRYGLVGIGYEKVDLQVALADK